MLSTKNEFSNITESIESKLGRNLYKQKNHPIEIIKNKIYDYFLSLNKTLDCLGLDNDDYKFEIYEDFSPVVSTENNFDLLRISEDHPSRSKSDTYYVNEKEVLRTHTSAHQNQLLATGKTAFLITADVYRKDEINKTHYPIFHQMEGVHICTNDDDAKKDLIRILSGLVEVLFPNCEYRINDDYFPFTDPSFEFEVKYKGSWLEILGCGVIHRDILNRHNIKHNGWAFGLGLERLAMILFDIQDIRYFWSTHSRFIEQFKSGDIIKFKPFSELESISFDISFWIPIDQIIQSNDTFLWKNENDFMELVRNIVSESVEEVKLIDKFKHPKNEKYSCAYRIKYSPIDPDIKDPAIFKEIALKYHSKIESILLKYNLILR